MNTETATPYEQPLSDSTIVDLEQLDQFAFAVEGEAFDTTEHQQLRYHSRTLFLIDQQGTIMRQIRQDEASPKQYARLRQQIYDRGTLVSLQSGQYLIPGYVDLHVHAPQWAQAGAALDEPLEVWLTKYTFPTEARFKNLEYAHSMHQHLVSTLLKLGTTSALYYDTIDRASAVDLAQVCASLGQRGFVGKVVMDDPNANPDYYCERTDEALQETENFILQVRELASRRGAHDRLEYPQGVHPVVTPRFIPSCTDAALEGLGALAQRHQTFIQSHCSESDWEHNTVMQRYGYSDTVAHDRFGLLTERSVLHHCAYLSEPDAQLFAQRGASVAHCPISNVYFANAVAPIARYLQQGVKVGLGSDISGGYCPSIAQVMRSSSLVSRVLHEGTRADLTTSHRAGLPGSVLSLETAFYLATRGGAQSLHLRAGSFEPGFAWDAQVIDAHAPAYDLPIFERTEEPTIVAQKLLNLYTPSNIAVVWAQGQLVAGNLHRIHRDMRS